MASKNDMPPTPQGAQFEISLLFLVMYLFAVPLALQASVRGSNAYWSLLMGLSFGGACLVSFVNLRTQETTIKRFLSFVFGSLFYCPLAAAGAKRLLEYGFLGEQFYPAISMLTLAMVGAWWMYASTRWEDI